MVSGIPQKFRNLLEVSGGKGAKSVVPVRQERRTRLDLGLLLDAQ